MREESTVNSDVINSVIVSRHISSLLRQPLIDQGHSMLYEPVGELRKVPWNALKPGVDKNTFPVILLTVGPAPHCAV